jgi:hypothetical protein
MTPTKDSSTTTIAEHSIDLRTDFKNVMTLTPEATVAHFDLLADMLAMIATLVAEKLPKDGGNNPDLLKYLKKLSNTLKAFIFKHKLESMKPNSDIRLSCTIDPTDSGFPIFIRDFKFLANDKENAAEELNKLPNNDRLVDDALFLLFRGLFPKDVILQKFTRNYYETLTKLSLPELLKIHPIFYIKEEDEMHYCKQSFERLDDHHNIPRFYTLYFKVPAKTFSKSEEWKTNIEQAITDGLSTVVNLELGYLAKQIEAIEGVQLEYIERFDIGPFYSLFTENSDTVKALIESERDCILMYSKSTVVRTGEEERTGFGERIKVWQSGDTHLGTFSPVITSPQYILMPHRLIQKVHNLNIVLKEHTQMYGIEDFQ